MWRARSLRGDLCFKGCDLAACVKCIRMKVGGVSMQGVIRKSSRSERAAGEGLV